MATPPRAPLPMKSVVAGAVTGLVLGYLVGYNNVYMRQQGQARLSEQHIAQEQADQNAQQQVTELLSQLERYREQLPPEPDPSWLVQEAVAAGQQSDITLASIAQAAPQATKHYTRLSVTLQFNASYHQLGTFLDRLEHSPRFVRIEGLHIEPRRQGSSDASSVELTLGTLYVPPARSQAPAGSL